MYNISLNFHFSHTHFDGTLFVIIVNKLNSADLEAAVKARSKIHGTNVEDAMKITQLYNTLHDLDGFASTNILTTIVSRLSSLSYLHSSSMNFQSQLSQLEHVVKDVELTLGSMEESAKLVQNGMAENMKIIQRNMEHMDQQQEGVRRGN